MHTKESYWVEAATVKRQLRQVQIKGRAHIDVGDLAAPHKIVAILLQTKAG